jgi:hypothetical protein
MKYLKKLHTSLHDNTNVGAEFLLIWLIIEVALATILGVLGYLSIRGMP